MCTATPFPVPGQVPLFQGPGSLFTLDWPLKDHITYGVYYRELELTLESELYGMALLFGQSTTCLDLPNRQVYNIYYSLNNVL